MLGVWGKPAERDFGPSLKVSLTLLKTRDDNAFLWPRRKALADGGGRGTTSCGGLGDFLGGDELRDVKGLELISFGGDTSARKVGVFAFGGDEV